MLRLGWSGHIAAGQSVLLALRDTRAASSGERALCRALLALLSIALDDPHAARRLARQAISESARPLVATPAAELRWLRLARALAANASVLVGDRVRGRRAAAASFLEDDPESAWLVAARAAPAWDDAPFAARGYARFVAAVHERYAARPARGPLTATEIAILSRIAAGATVTRVAQALGRSPHTVRTHLRNAYAKLGAHGLLDALAKAHALGLLDARIEREKPSSI